MCAVADDAESSPASVVGIETSVEMGGRTADASVGEVGDLLGMNSPVAFSSDARLSSGIFDAALNHPPGKNLEEAEDSSRFRPAEMSGKISGEAPFVIEVTERGETDDLASSLSVEVGRERSCTPSVEMGSTLNAS